MVEFPLLPAVIVLILLATSALLWGFVVGGRIGYNERLRAELEETVDEMRRRTEQYRAARNMSPLSPTFAYGSATARRRALTLRFSARTNLRASRTPQRVGRTTPSSATARRPR